MSDVYEYLCVDEFLANFTQTQALNCALQTGLIDVLSDQAMTHEELLQSVDDSSGLALLLDILVFSTVLRLVNGAYSLSDSFIVALQYRDLLEMKIQFSNMTSPDLMKHSRSFFHDMPEFMHESTMFSLFDYQRCYELTEDNIRDTQEWMSFTTVYTRYEAHVCMLHHDFSKYQSMLDLGGNSGEFAFQICLKNNELSAVVADLPVVCEVGRRHLSAEPEASRVRFVATDIFKDVLPSEYDLISLKSVLHDWPEDACSIFIQKAFHGLRPGGTILIFERGATVVSEKTLSYSALPIFLFTKFFRSALVYEKHLEMAGFVDIQCTKVELDMTFSLLTATRPA